MSVSAYAVLGVSADADADALRRAYRHRARQLHPDLNPGNVDATRRFQELAEAYALLADPTRRAEYDARRVRDERPHRPSAATPGPATASPPAPVPRPWPGRARGTVLVGVRLLVRPGRPVARRPLTVPAAARALAERGPWWSLAPGGPGGPAFWLEVTVPRDARGVLRDAVPFELQGTVVALPLVATIVDWRNTEVPL